MELVDIFTYWWGHQDNESDMTISCYGLTEGDQSVYLKITGFKPYIYLELDTNISWTNGLLQEITRDFKNRFRDIDSIKYVKRKKLFYNHKYQEEGEWKDKLFPYLLIHFNKKISIYNFEKYVKSRYTIKSLNRQTHFKVHENNASPVLQYICNQNLPTSNWIKFRGRIVESENRESKCDFEYICKYDNVLAIHNKTQVPSATVMSFDLEANSSNPGRMPNALLAADKIFQISCVIGKTNSLEPEYKYLITLGKVNHKLLDESITVIECPNEGNVLLSFTDLIHKHNPQLLMGYNIFSFDIPYMIERSRQTNVYYDFTIQGYNDSISQEKEIRWSSTAYKNQCFKYLDVHGRLYVDMLPIIQRDYKLNNYKLKTVSDMFVGETKDPLTAKDIFKCYKIGMKDINDEASHNAMSIVGKYCVQDSVLVYKLFYNLQTWFGLVEMATTCNVPIFTLYTQGQQIKVFSQIYKVCLQKGYVVEKDGYIADENDKLTGAIVLEPIPGVYDKITPFDFTSLYPTTIIAYNLCFSTLVRDDDSIADDLCHVIEYAEHKGCDHDDSGVKLKPDKIVCQHHRYRFLKNPKGIVPVLLEDLLEARTNTRKKQKELKKEMSREGITNNEKNQLQLEYQVLEKRQLAYKVSANSVYGAYGTRKGYLPFLPGAQCTTAMGRENIIKAGKYIQEHYNAKLVYGDSVTGDTPILVKKNLKFTTVVDITTIDKLNNGEWKPYKQFKFGICGLSGKEQSTFDGYIWSVGGWTRIKRVIRHKTNKKIYQVKTDNAYIKVTEDHSLIDEKGKYVKPLNVKDKKLFHSWPQFTNKFIYNITIQYARLIGLCIGCKNFIKNGTIYLQTTNVKVQNELVDNYQFQIENGMLYSKSKRLFYHLGNSCESIPHIILNSTIESRFEFLYGYLDAFDCEKNKIMCRTQIIAQGMYYILKSIHSSNLSLVFKNNLYEIDVNSQDGCNNVEIEEIQDVGDIYVYDIETDDGTFHAGVGELIVKNTDSVYVNFPEFHDKQCSELWDFCEKVEKEINSLFMKPMHLSFESAIYERFLILTKKRYICLKADKDGHISDKLTIRGVLLTRRDNADIIRQIYKDTVMAILYKNDKNEILENILSRIEDLFIMKNALASYIITKSIGDVGDYKVRPLSDDVQKRTKRLKDLHCNNEEDYKLKSLPANVQLSEKMRRRGKLITAGQRIEYVVTNMDKHNGKQFEKIEDCDYVIEHGDLINIDSLYYLKLMSTPMDELLYVGLNIKDYVSQQYKWRLGKWKCMNELKFYFKNHYREILID
jgi:DNA polymerase elongation subunit (family B)